MYIEIKNKDGYNLLTKDKVCREDIEVKPLLQSKEVTESGEVTADVGYAGLEKVTVNVASGASLNIAYGATAPEDTSKLWVEGAEPSKVIATNKMNGTETIELLSSVLPQGAYGLSCASVGTNIYVFGGRVGTSQTNQILKFDTLTKTITTLTAVLPNAMFFSSCASVGTNIYVFGGYTTNNYTYYKTILKFNTETETITTLSATLPSVRSKTTSASVGTDIYIFGGQTSSSGYTNQICKFDTLTETITTLSTTLPSVMYYASCASVGTNIYIFGGRNSSGAISSILKFDTLTKTITTLTAVLPKTTDGTTSANIGTNIYIFGGYNSGKLATILKFDTLTETITTLSVVLPQSTYEASCASVGTNVYIFGDTALRDTIYDFAVSVDLPQNQLLLNTTLNKNLFKIINAPTAEIEIGVNGVYRGNANNIAELETANVYDANQYAWVDIQSGAIVEKLASVVTITSQASEYAFNVYDGTNTSGTLVATLGGANGVLTAKVPCFSGYLYFQNTNASTAWEGFTVASNMTVTGGTDNYQLVQVNGDGAISATVVEVSAGFTVQMSTTGNGATVYDGQTASGAGVAINGTAKEVTCTSGYLLVTFGSSYYYSSGYDITGSITGQEVTSSGSGYNDIALLFTVGSDGSILNISVSLD